MAEASKSATDLLTESERAVTLRDRHRDYFVALAEQAEVELRGPDQASWRELIESEYDNLRLALEWSLAQGNSEAALALAIAIDSVWYMRGDPLLSREWLERALAIAEGSSTALRTRGLIRLSTVIWQAGDMTQSLNLAVEALQVAHESADLSALHKALNNLGLWRYINAVGGVQASRRYLEEGLRIAREMEDELAIATSLGQLASRISQQEGREAARAVADEALRLHRKHGDREHIAWSIYGRGWEEDPSVGMPLAEESLAIGRELKDDTLILCAIELIGWQKRFSGDYLGALKVFEDAVEEYRHPGRKWPIPWGVSWMLNEMAEIELEMADYEAADRHSAEALEINQKLAYKADLIWSLYLQGKVASAAGDYSKAKSFCEQSLALARDTGRHLQINLALRSVAEVALWADDYPTAVNAAEEARIYARGVGRGRDSLALLGNIYTVQGDLDKARSSFEEYLDSIRTHPWWPYEEPAGQLGLGRVALMDGEPETASALYGAALSKLQEIGHEPFIAWALEEFGALAASAKDFHRASILFGAADGIRKETRAGVPMSQRRFYEESLAAIKAGLVEESLQKAWTTGRSLGLHDAVRCALEGKNAT
ncbi:MAG: tetratricopeptide repeat protein [Actinobacteria bacterium]|nr:tetratricopeptide repeat protein [Actinomycetota bacterium]